MKRFALAATLLAITGAASAQSSVTLFGIVDLNLSQYKGGSAVGGQRLRVMNDGTTNGLNGSRWGMKVTEDLGNGVRAGALLESGFGADTGAALQGGRAFGRQAFISLSSNSLGELRLGRQYVLSDSVMGRSDPFGNGLVSNPGTGVTNAGRPLPMFLNAPRADNVVQYETPALGPVVLGAQVAPGEGTADRFMGVRAMLDSGPVSAGLSYESNKSRATGATGNKVITFGANYNFGVFKVLGGAQRNRSLNTTSVNGTASGIGLIVTGPAGSFTADRSDLWTLGVEAPVTPALSLGANYVRGKYRGAAAGNATLGKASLLARYGLSKNTFVYAGVSTATGDLKNYISQKTVAQLGLRKAF